MILNLLFLSYFSMGGQLQVDVVDQNNKPVQNAALAVFGKNIKQRELKSVQTVEQKNQGFFPRVTVLKVGDAVRFTNEDTYNHHVYSGSKTNPFQLPQFSRADKGPPPVPFKKPGMVPVGCNIHDNMLAYIYVVETSVFSVSKGKTVNFDKIEPGQYSLKVWHPDSKFSEKPKVEKFVLTADKPQVKLKVELKTKIDVENDKELNDLFSKN